VFVLIEMECNGQKILNTTIFSNITPSLFVLKLLTFRMNMLFPYHDMKKETFFTVTAERTQISLHVYNVLSCRKLTIFVKNAELIN
jgi:hypothetical protein